MKIKYFTLIEVVVAMAVLGLALVGFFAMSNSAVQRIDKAYSHWERMHLLSQAAEYYLLFADEEPPYPPPEIFANLFQGAPMVLVPPRFDDPELLQWAEDMLEPCKFGSFSVTTAQEHDKMIAFTSQMPHIVSNAYIKSPTAREHKGFSAGSYKDLTRVAWLNPQMWAELFLSNKENILNELTFYIDSLSQYKDALTQENEEKLIALLDEGRKRKEEVDG